MQKQKISFIINPVAGGKNKSLLEKTLTDEFSGERFDINIFFSEFVEHASSLARAEMEDGAGIIVAVGGDGTINEIAKVLVDTNVKLGIIPFGSGNGFARHFGIPLEFSEAVKLLKTCDASPVDVGMVNEQAFFCTSGIGFDAETGYQFSLFGKRGFVPYAVSFLKVYKNYRSSSYKIEIGESEYETEAFFINIANTSQFGYNFRIAPEASADDGYLDLVIIRKFPKWKGLYIAALSLTGNISRSKFVEHRKIKKIRIISKEDQPRIHIDGEIKTGSSEMFYYVRPSCLHVILPRT